MWQEEIKGAKGGSKDILNDSSRTSLAEHCPEFYNYYSRNIMYARLR